MKGVDPVIVAEYIWVGAMVIGIFLVTWGVVNGPDWLIFGGFVTAGSGGYLLLCVEDECG